MFVNRLRHLMSVLVPVNPLYTSLFAISHGLEECYLYPNIDMSIDQD